MAKNSYPINLESLWERLLSRDKDEVQAAFSVLIRDEQETVLAHLRRIPGWHPEQRLSAQLALKALVDP